MRISKRGRGTVYNFFFSDRYHDLVGLPLAWLICRCRKIDMRPSRRTTKSTVVGSSLFEARRIAWTWKYSAFFYTSWLLVVLRTSVSFDNLSDLVKNHRGNLFANPWEAPPRRWKLSEAWKASPVYQDCDYCIWNDRPNNEWGEKKKKIFLQSSFLVILVCVFVRMQLQNSSLYILFVCFLVSHAIVFITFEFVGMFPPPYYTSLRAL